MYDILRVDSVSNNINDLTFTDYYYRLTMLARVMFKWDGLPNGIDEKWIEKYLFTEGSCMFFHDDNLGYMVSRCNLDGGLNEYDEPVSLRPYATNYKFGHSYQNNKECVLIRNNDLMLPTTPTIKLYSWRLAELQRAIDLNVYAQRTPILIKCSEKQRLTLKNVYKQWSGDSPVIFGDKELDIGDFTVLKTDAPIVFDKLQLQKHAIWNEVMTFLGLDNANQDKKERLVSDEVSANDEQIELSAHIMLKARERACELINTLYPDVCVSVRLRTQQEMKEFIDDNVNDVVDIEDGEEDDQS